MIEVGTWKSFDDIEDHLILDELLLLTEQLTKKKRHQLRVSMLAQGVDIDEDEEAPNGNDDLPEELLEAERKFKEEKERKRAEKAAKEGMQSFGDGLGYEVVT